MEWIVGLRSGIVDGIYVVVLEVLVIFFLLKAVDMITMQLGKRTANERRHLRVVSRSWMGRGTTASGYVLRACVTAAVVISILMITFGTNGFTQTEIVMSEAVFVSKTSNTDAQFQVAVDTLEGSKAVSVLTSKLALCSQGDRSGSEQYVGYCDTKLCKDSIDIERFLEREEFLTLEEDAVQNGRCNDGVVAPEVSITYDMERSANATWTSGVRIAETFSPDDWTLLVESDLHRVYALQGYQIPIEGEPSLDVRCAKVMNTDCSVYNCLASRIIGPDLMNIGLYGAARIETFDDGNGLELDPKLGVEFRSGEMEGYDVRLTNTDLLSAEQHETWMWTATLLSLSYEFNFNSWLVLRTLSWRAALGTHATEMVNSEATRISTVALVGFIILGSCATFVLLMLLACVLYAKRMSYEDLNLALSDREIYGLMKNEVDHLGDGRTAAADALRLGVWSESKQWEVMREGDQVGTYNLKEL